MIDFEKYIITFESLGLSNNKDISLIEDLKLSGWELQRSWGNLLGYSAQRFDRIENNEKPSLWILSEDDLIWYFIFPNSYQWIIEVFLYSGVLDKINFRTFGYKKIHHYNCDGKHDYHIDWFKDKR